MQPLTHDTPHVSSTVKLDQAPEPEPQLRLALFWDAADLSRPDKALWRELLDLFYYGDGIARAIAWELWSFADHRTGAVPEHVTPRTLAESTGWNVKKTIRAKLADLAHKGVVRRTRPQNKRRSFRYEMNLGGLWKRRQRRTPTTKNGPVQPRLDDPLTGQLTDSSSSSMPPTGATKRSSMPPTGATKRSSMPPTGATKRSSMPPTGATTGEYVRERTDQENLAVAAYPQRTRETTKRHQQQQQDRQFRRKDGLVAWIMSNCRIYDIAVEEAGTDIADNELEDTVTDWPLAKLQSLANNMKHIIAEKEQLRRYRL